MTVWLWIGFTIIIAAILIFDLAIIHRRHRSIGVYESLAWTGFWIVFAFSLNIAIYYLYEHHAFGVGLSAGHELDGRSAALQFLTGYLVEKSLSLENIFIIALIFAHFRLPLEHQHRVLFWGVPGAVVLRGVMIAGGVVLIERFAWVTYALGVVLVASAMRLLLHRGELQPQRSPLVRLARRFVPLGDGIDGDRFLTVSDGRQTATTLLVALILVVGADLVCALDSVAAIMAVTRDPFLIFSANVCAILGLRPLYFAVAGLLPRLRYLKLSLVFLLGFLGVKLLLETRYPLVDEIALLSVAALLATGALLSAFLKPRATAPVSPLADDLGELLVLTMKGARRIVILVIGSTVVLIGIAMIVLPGPAIVVIPAGLAILATEFIWARRLLQRLKHEASNLKDSARGFFRRKKNGDRDADAGVTGEDPEKKRNG
ncbi:MAG: TerC/Alx family metal homeostasis membrane protein [Gammaproteobacteria bacterium]|nr:TerC/Alx family metal homeostasis membrane protein [Gammaproteobacteria bacterium]